MGGGASFVPGTISGASRYPLENLYPPMEFPCTMTTFVRRAVGAIDREKKKKTAYRRFSV